MTKPSRWPFPGQIIQTGLMNGGELEQVCLGFGIEPSESDDEMRYAIEAEITTNWRVYSEDGD